MSLCVFLWFQVFSGWNWGTWAKILFRGWKRTADAVGFWPPCTQSGFSGAKEAQLERSQLRWKVDILGFPAIYNSPYFARVLMTQTGVQTPTSCPILELYARNRLQIRVKRQKQATTWRLTPKRVSTHESSMLSPSTHQVSPEVDFYIIYLSYVTLATSLV